MTSTTRTARCGPACRVVWEGNEQDFWPSPIPIIINMNKYLEALLRGRFISPTLAVKFVKLLL
jgi:hypothetical protein